MDLRFNFCCPFLIDGYNNLKYCEMISCHFQKGDEIIIIIFKLMKIMGNNLQILANYLQNQHKMDFKNKSLIQKPMDVL